MKQNTRIQKRRTPFLLHRLQENDNYIFMANPRKKSKSRKNPVPKNDSESSEFAFQAELKKKIDQINKPALDAIARHRKTIPSTIAIAEAAILPNISLFDAFHSNLMDVVSFQSSFLAATKQFSLPNNIAQGILKDMNKMKEAAEKLYAPSLMEATRLNLQEITRSTSIVVDFLNSQGLASSVTQHTKETAESIRQKTMMDRIAVLPNERISDDRIITNENVNDLREGISELIKIHVTAAVEPKMEAMLKVTNRLVEMFDVLQGIHDSTITCSCGFVIARVKFIAYGEFKCSKCLKVRRIPSGDVTITPNFNRK